MKDRSTPAHCVSTSIPPTPRRPLRWINRLLVICLLWLSGIQPSWATAPASLAQTSRSATITVTNTNDTGPGSLRQAIADANPGDTIVIGVTGTIFLLSGELVIAKNLTIQGPGATSLALSGEFQNRVLRISSGVTVEISQLTIKEGLTDANGGGIYNDGTLTLVNSVVADSTSSGSSGTHYGGGIYSTGPLTLIDSAVTNNTVSGGSLQGSAIYSTEIVTLVGTKIDRNNSGTALVLRKGARINDCDISWNGGTAISVVGVAEIVATTISNNAGTGVAGSGDLTITDSTLAKNYGAGVNRSGNFTVTNSSIIDSSGVGIQSAQGKLLLVSSTISGSASYAIANSGEASISMVSLRGSRASGITNSGQMHLTNSTVSGNTNNTSSYQGGGIYNSGIFTATNSTISGNQIGTSSSTANVYGGGIYNIGAIYLFNSTVANNALSSSSSSYPRQGGGIYSDSSGSVYLRNSIIDGNSASQGPDIYGTVQSQGYNFIGSTSGATILGATVGNLSGDAKLGSLAANGGPTQTHALLPDSPAIDAGKDTGCRDGENEFLLTDQRGSTRPQDGDGDGNAICDIGAFELGAADLPTPTPTPAPDPATIPSLTAISPTEGPAAGGTTLTLQGGNFQSGMTVKVDGTACTNVVINNSSNATCSTRAHFPAVVDVTVTNPGGQQATLLRGFTYRGSTASLSLPDVIVDSGSSVEVPIQGTGISGLMAVSLTLSYDNSVANLQNVTVGGLTGGWSLISNTVSSGRVQISMANPGAPAQGTGSLALLHFQATGTPGQTSPLTIQGVSLNDGTIPTTTTVGSLIIETLSTLAGQVRYWTEDRPVPGVSLNLTGPNSLSGTSDSAGAYSLADIPSGNYTLAPGKSDGVGVDAITSYDAALVLRHSAGVEILNGNTATAADVDGSSSITPMDASYILRKSVRLIDVPFPGAGRIWKFTPASRSYAPLTADQSAQDFTALLIGDVSGNWGSSQGQSRTDTEPVRLRLAEVDRDGAHGYLLSLLPGPHLIYSLDLSLRPLHKGVLQEEAPLPSVALASSVQGVALSSNSPTPDHLYIAVAGATPIRTDGDLLVIHWVDSSGKPVTGPTVEVIEARINEGRIPVIIEVEAPQEDVDTWGKIFLPAVGR